MLTAALGVIAGFNQPARLALIPSLVRREDLAAAVAINSIIFNSARFIGPAVAGLMIVTGGISAAFAANAVSFIFFLVALSRIHLEPRPDEVPVERRSLLGDVAARHPLCGTSSGNSAAAASADDRLHLRQARGGTAAGVRRRRLRIRSRRTGVLTSTVGAGAVLGGLWLARRSGDPAGLTTIALGNTLVLALSLLAFVASDRWWIALPALAVLGACMVITGVGTQTLLQLSVEGNHARQGAQSLRHHLPGWPRSRCPRHGHCFGAAGLRLPLAVGSLLAMLAWIWTWSARARITRALEAAGMPTEWIRQHLYSFANRDIRLPIKWNKIYIKL